MNQDELKQVKNVFKDYRSINRELLEAKIKLMNLFKKTNSLQLVLLTTKQIKIRDISSFENYLKSRFGIRETSVKVETQEAEDLQQGGSCETNELQDNSKAIEKEWTDIIDYISNKHPMTKAILNNSTISIDGSVANVMLQFKGKQFLLANKFDNILANLLLDIYGKRYKVSYTEDVSEELINRKKEYAEEIQKQEIIKLQKQSILDVEQNKKENINAKEEKQEQEFYDANSFVPPIDDKDITIEDEAYIQELNEINQEENIILGSVSKAKENLCKIKDIEASNKRITIEGKIVSCEARETKTGKGMLIFDIYDGTGIITCKSFTKNIEEGKEVADKIKNASGIKLIGKAGLDSYVGDVTVMANTIAQINGDNFPKIPSEDENSPLILGMNENIKEPLIKIQDLNVDSGNVCIDGEVIAMESKETKSGKIILSIDIYDGSSTMTCKCFLTKENQKKVIGKIENSKGIKLAGRAQMDTFTNEITIMANTIVTSTGIKRETRMDNAEVKRVELHMHTKMSQMDGVSEATDLIKRAMKWGMKSIAITDHRSCSSLSRCSQITRI